MFLKDEEMKDLKNNQFTKIRSAEMYAIDYGVVRRVKSLFLKPLKVSERMSPFGLQAKLYGIWNYIVIFTIIVRM